MRPLILSLVATLVVGCGSNKAQRVSRVEVRASGLIFAVDARGNGKAVANFKKEGRPASVFEIDRVRYKRLLDQIEAFKPASGPTAETSRRFVSGNCPLNAPQITDAGMISIRWIGLGLDHIYVADLGCDPKRNAARNHGLRAVVEDLPVPRS